MMEIFPSLLTTPFRIIEQIILHNKGNTTLDGVIKKDDTHKLEKEVEESLKKIMKGKKISIDQNNIQNIIKEATLVLNNQKKQKKSSETG